MIRRALGETHSDWIADELDVLDVLLVQLEDNNGALSREFVSALIARARQSIDDMRHTVACMRSRESDVPQAEDFEPAETVSNVVPIRTSAEAE